jgi:hypothetical protein
MTAKKRRHPPLVYRVLGDGREARFVAERTTRTREVSADSTTEVSIASGEVRVEQHLDLRVAFEALNRIVLDLPADLAARRDVSYLIDGQPVLPFLVNESRDAPSAGVAASAATKSWFDQHVERIAIEPPTAIEDPRGSRLTCAKLPPDAPRLPRRSCSICLLPSATILSNAACVLVGRRTNHRPRSMDGGPWFANRRRPPRVSHQRAVARIA